MTTSDVYLQLAFVTDVSQTLKTDLLDIEDKVATLTEKAKYSTFKFEANEPGDTLKSIGYLYLSRHAGICCQYHNHG
jgi:hypothetical protein